MEKLDPEDGEHETGTLPAMLSVALGENDTAVPPAFEVEAL